MKRFFFALVLFLGAARSEDYTRMNSTDCPSPHWSFEEFSEKLTVSDECIKSLANQWTSTQYAAIIDNMNRLTSFFRKQAGVCKGAIPAECPTPAVHINGGLVCVSSEGRRFCKPMCNEGYDFSFLRTSRLYEECSNSTKHKWTTQYIGGHELAECNESTVQISGASSAYFPKGQDCWKTKSEQAMEKKIIKFFKDELSANNIKGPFIHSCVLCG
ncbi:uncharacterized protein si:ch1073-126c3.2 isoform X2 [Trichomycterus rosablanca]|uniref:uncharacterized protein si:ch1073-126c3.2 isoform X2 n=1 Tax=Trichomycterus rosablanca TaxID=2290929 RepID=UPI002F359133